MIRRRQPEAPLEAFDVSDDRLVEWEVDLPDQGSVTEDPVAGRGWRTVGGFRIAFTG